MIDIGVNLGNSQLRNRIPELLTEARKAGIEHILVTGTDLNASTLALDICQQYPSERYPRLSSTAGVHPHDASTWNAESELVIRKLLAQDSVVAVGETGLDFNRNFSGREDQETAFRAQLEIAIETQKPLFLHERDAYDAQTAILDDYRSQQQLPPVVIHCFTGSLEALEGYLERGYWIGITGWVCDERRGKALAEIVPKIPLDKLMVETDAPFLLPRNIEPKPESRTNKPAYLPWVVKKLAECYQLPESEIAEATTQNAKTFFNLS